jgi:hypothetical protein
MLELIFLLIELELLGLEVPVLVVVLKVVKSDSRIILWVILLLLLLLLLLPRCRLTLTTLLVVL